MNELLQMTKNMEKEMSQTPENTNNSNINKDNIAKVSNSPMDFNMPFDGNEDNYMKELEKLLKNNQNFDLDDSDPQTKEMLKLLNDNLKELEEKFNTMNTSEASEINKMSNTNSNNNNNNSNEININNNNSENKTSNPFVDTFRDMSNNSGVNNILEMFNNFGGQGSGINPDANMNEGMGDIKNLYDILGKLSDQNQKEDSVPDDQKNKNLHSLFENLLEFLLKSEMLSEPLSQIKKSSVTSYLEKNKDKLSKEDEEKYKNMLNYIEVISAEINKPEPNKTPIIEVFYKLHELSDFDNDLLTQANPSFKEFSDLLGSNLPKK